MRFPQLPVGGRFSFRGRRYTKTGPVTAREDESGAERLINKAAEIEPLDLAAGGQSTGRPYTREEVAELCADYRARLRQAVLSAAGSADVVSLTELLQLIELQGLPIEGD